MTIINRYLFRPKEILIPARAYNPHLIEMSSYTRCVVDTGSQMSAIETSFAKDELGLVPVNSDEVSVSQPACTGEMIKSVAPEVKLQIKLENPGFSEIEKTVTCLMWDKLDDRTDVKIILGMDFLNDIDFVYFFGKDGATFMMSQTP